MNLIVINVLTFEKYSDSHKCYTLAKLQRHLAAAAAKSLQLCPTPSDPMDCSLPGSSVHGIFQAGVLEWDAIAFSDKDTLE